MMVVSYQTCGLQTVDEFILFGQLPVERHAVLFVIPPSVKPNASNGTIFGQQLSQLVVHECIVAFPIRLVTAFAAIGSRTSHWIVIPHPVQMAVIEMQADTLLLTGLREFLDYVAAKRCCLHNIVLALLGFPHGKSIVMATGKTDVFCTGLLEATHPLACIEPMGIKGVGSLGIFMTVRNGILQVPLSLCKGAVYSPMQEYSQFHIPEFFAGFKVGLGWFVLSLGIHTTKRRQANGYCQ